jgi:arylsulfatase A-like enzyme
MKSLFQLIACLGLFASPGFAAEAKQPNIVVIVADDLGYADVLFNPQHPKEVTTPNLDQLAKESVICRQGYVTGNVCSPTRTGLMTGRYQQRLGLYTAGEAGSGVPMSERLFPQYLKPAGYATCQLGKWHLGPTPEWSPALRGFDEVFGFLGRGAHDYFKLNDPDDPIYRGTNVVQETGYLTDRLGEEAESFIQRKKAQPFFLYLAFNAVHAPLQAPAEEIAKFNTSSTDRNTLLAMGKRMDDAIGKVVATLKQSGVWENTLLFFISDNGGPLAQTAVNTPLRGGKHQDYEGGIRVPFLVCWPGQLKPGENQAPVIALDILPTALAAAGVATPDAKPLDGKNILPILRGEVAPQSRNFFWCSGSQEGWWAVRSGDWKLVGDKARVGLFDLNKDVSEKNDLAKTRPEKIVELTKLHDAWLAEMPNPVKAGAKRYGMTAPEGTKEKRPKSERKKKQPAASAGAGSTAVQPATLDVVHESFATLPVKPWKAARGNWEAKNGALWAVQKADDEQDALLRGPADFRNGMIQYDVCLKGATRHILRFRGADNAMLFRVEITSEGISLVRTTDRNETLAQAALKLNPETWQTLTVVTEASKVTIRFAGTILNATDATLDTVKTELNFLVTGNAAGFRNFSLVRQ